MLEASASFFCLAEITWALMKDKIWLKQAVEPLDA